MRRSLALCSSSSGLELGHFLQTGKAQRPPALRGPFSFEESPIGKEKQASKKKGNVGRESSSLLRQIEK